MAKLKYKYPMFILGDIVKVKKTGSLAMIGEVNRNTCQVEDIHQWSYSIETLDKKARDHNAWYDNTELVLVRDASFSIPKGELSYHFIRRRLISNKPKDAI